MSEPSISAVTTTAPPIMSEEPIATASGGDETLVCRAPANGAEATAEPGARALVERFGGQQGTGGTGDVPEVYDPPHGPSCRDDAMRAVGACGAAGALGTGTGGGAAVFAGFVCAGALDGYLECLESQQKQR